MEKANVKAQIKSNFQSLSFEDAIKANEALLPEYIEQFGQRSYNSLKAYYKNHQPEGIAAEAAPAEAEVITAEDEAEDFLEAIGGTTEGKVEDVFEEDPVPADTTEEAPKEEVKPFHFGNMETFDEDEIKALLATKNPTLKSKCIIIMSFVVQADNFIDRSIRMIVNNDGKGWESWEEARKYMTDHDIKNEYKHGTFAGSKACFPIGETYIKAWAEWVDYALQNYYLDRKDSDCKVDYVEYAELDAI